ncbi:A24 family peptidase [Rhizorhapis suberifaciens]|uniref:Prepilin peptidase CpaA n=1 Tax=Rhizorhapis suberifaciens TaxID=13656 RepID=A0A840HX34_9SPHN|nr:prepilin peptidase [Rhizorhapis suberifaciens]MBB4642129.1 prepilin peptidase CpaA [Rhizorhapis suberifaciens]
MDRQFFILTLVAALSALLVIAAFTDIKSRIISNRLNITVAALAPLFWIATGLPLWPGMFIQIVLATIIFISFALMFALGFMGGGDVKLLGALALWLPLQPMMTLLLVMSILGGAVTAVTVLHHKIGRHTGRPEIPYGVAIALAGLWVVGERYFNHFA